MKNVQQWKEVAIIVATEAEEIVANLLNEEGANGVIIEDKRELTKSHREMYGEMYDLDRKKYPETGTRLKAYFPYDHRWLETFNTIEERLKQLDLPEETFGSYEISVQTMADSDWEHEWKKYFKPKKVTDTFIIVPEWETYERQTDDELIITIDPGMAFGTGEHPTTIQSLQGLERTVKQGDIVIDVGCGSGVLSVAAALLNAEHVYAYDLDPVAVRSTELNRDLNRFSQTITVSENNLLNGVTTQANVIVANILAHIIEQLIPDAWINLTNGGYFVTAGIIDSQKNAIEQRLIEQGFTIVEVDERERWVSIIARKLSK